KRPQGQRQACGLFRPYLPDCPGQCCPKVIVLALQRVEPLVFPSTTDVRRTTLGESQVPLEVLATGPSSFLHLLELLAAVVTDGFEQAIAARALVQVDQRLVRQPREQLEHVRMLKCSGAAVDGIVACTDRLGRLEGEAAGEDRQPPEEGTLAFVQQ